MRKAFLFVFCALLSACAGHDAQTPPALPALSTSAQTDNAAVRTFAATTWNVQTGASDDYYAIQDLDFYPASITIDAGDSIAYRVASGSGGDAHTISYVPPGMPVPSPGDPKNVIPAGGTTIDGTQFVNSGILLGGQYFTLHFPKAGTYRILCLFHYPAMVSTVTVNAAGTPYPHDQGYYVHLGEQDEWQDFSEAAQALSSFPFPANGTTLAAGIAPGLIQGPEPDSTILRFLTSGDLGALPAEGSITVKVGTILTWTNETTNEPHTVTFAKAGQNELPEIPPDPPVNVVPPPGITKYDGSQIVNSGSFFAGQSFKLEFTKPGTYFYGCLYHDNSRMTGWVTVTQ